MIKFVPTDNKKLLHLKYEGKVTQQDYKKTLIPTLEHENLKSVFQNET